ncbi:MAG: type II toxin-antitoxin system HicB family antitoxin [Planctomycetota bacterium]|nr:MAG: type II toxin-antitoxin system HicB family antitoxin [Planctomycetota bacterium]
MEIPVLIEPVAGNGYRARGGEPLALSADGATPAEALAKLRQLLHERLQSGSRLVSLEVPSEDNPWRKMAGIFKDDPLFDAWQQAIADYRRQVDDDPDHP